MAIFNVLTSVTVKMYYTYYLSHCAAVNTSCIQQKPPSCFQQNEQVSYLLTADSSF